MDDSISLSSANIWGVPDGCPGYVKMSRQIPDVSGISVAMKEGIMAHGYAKDVLEKGWLDADMPRDMPDDIYECVKMYTGYCNDISTCCIDTAVAMEINGEHFSGACDFSCWKEDTYEFVSFTTGHSPVNAVENYELIAHAFLHSELLEQIKSLKIKLTVVQPRAYHPDGPIRTWETTIAELEPYFETLKTKAAEALSDNPSYNSGAHCRHCPGRHTCKAALDGGAKLYEASAHGDIQALTPEAMGVQLGVVKRCRSHLDAIITGLEENIKHSLKNAKPVPGWVLQPTKKHAKWTKPMDEVLRLGDELGFNFKQPTKPITPTQAIAKLSKLKIDPAVISGYSKKEDGPDALVPADEIIKRIFNNEKK